MATSGFPDGLTAGQASGCLGHRRDVAVSAGVKEAQKLGWEQRRRCESRPYLFGCGTLLGSGALGDRGVRLAVRRPRASPPDGRSHLMLAIHPNARTTPAVRAEIARSAEPTGELARRYGVSAETVREWRKRGPGECLDRSAGPHKLPWKASEEERAVVCALRRATGFPLDELAFVVRHFLPQLGRDNVYRILRAAGLSRRPAPATPERAAAKFKEDELGFVHLDV